MLEFLLLVDLVLVRHGIAVERIAGRDDPERPLTRRGLQRTEQMMSTLARGGLNVDQLITSSYRRALRTAQIALQAGLAPLLETDERLQPGGDVLGLLETLAGSVVLVESVGQLLPRSLQLLPAHHLQ